ncbi:hypothetical protein D3C76_1661020 [compost metagenome]
MAIKLLDPNIILEDELLNDQAREWSGDTVTSHNPVLPAFINLTLSQLHAPVLRAMYSNRP